MRQLRFCNFFLIIKVVFLAPLGNIQYWSVPILVLDIANRIYQFQKIAQNMKRDEIQEPDLISFDHILGPWNIFCADCDIFRETLTTPCEYYMFYENKLWKTLHHSTGLRKLPAPSVNVSRRTTSVTDIQ